MALEYWPIIGPQGIPGVPGAPGPVGPVGPAGPAPFFLGSLFSGTIQAAITEYHACSGAVGNAPSGSPPTIANENVTAMPRAGTIQHFSILIGTLQPLDGTLDVTINVNGVDTGITVSIPAAGGIALFTDAVHTHVCAVGDLVSVKFANNSPTLASAEIGDWTFIYA